MCSSSSILKWNCVKNHYVNCWVTLSFILNNNTRTTLFELILISWVWKLDTVKRKLRANEIDMKGKSDEEREETVINSVINVTFRMIFWGLSKHVLFVFLFKWLFVFFFTSSWKEDNSTHFGVYNFFLKPSIIHRSWERDVTISFNNNFVRLQVTLGDRKKEGGEKIVIVNVTWTNSCCLPNFSQFEIWQIYYFLLIKVSFPPTQFTFQTNSWFNIIFPPFPFFPLLILLSFYHHLLSPVKYVSRCSFKRHKNTTAIDESKWSKDTVGNNRKAGH